MPLYATVLKQGVKGAGGYAAAAAALSGIPATYKLPTKMKRVPTKKRATTDPNKLNLDSAATYHSVFVTWCQKNIRVGGRTIHGNCNAGVKLSTKVGDLGVFKMWINKGGIANLLSIPQLEKDGFRITSDTHGEWIVYLPGGDNLVFKRDAGNLKGMPYVI